MYLDSTNEVDNIWYFFSVAGINITQKLMHSLKAGLFDSALLNLLENESHQGISENELLLKAFDHWYFEMFSVFNGRWREAKVGIMAFNQFLQTAYDRHFLVNHARYLQEYVDTARLAQ
jgi:ELMO/CED-12 family